MLASPRKQRGRKTRQRDATEEEDSTSTKSSCDVDDHNAAQDVKRDINNVFDYQ